MKKYRESVYHQMLKKCIAYSGVLLAVETVLAFSGYLYYKKLKNSQGSQYMQYVVVLVTHMSITAVVAQQ